MARSSRGLSAELRSAVDRAAGVGRASLVGVAILAVGREGLETALFLWANTQAATHGTGSDAGPLAGATARPAPRHRHRRSPATGVP